LFTVQIKILKHIFQFDLWITDHFTTHFPFSLLFPNIFAIKYAAG